MDRKLNVRHWIAAFTVGCFDEKTDPKADVTNQIQAGWYDWFCKDSSLATKTKRMGNIIKDIKSGGKVNIEDWYVWFKNNCPLNGPLYDDFRFADMETGEVQLTIQIDCCWQDKKYTVWGRKKPGAPFNSEKPLFETDSVRELKNWLNTPWED